MDARWNCRFVGIYDSFKNIILNPCIGHVPHLQSVSSVCRMWFNLLCLRNKKPGIQVRITTWWRNVRLWSRLAVTNLGQGRLVSYPSNFCFISPNCWRSEQLCMTLIIYIIAQILQCNEKRADTRRKIIVPHFHSRINRYHVQWYANNRDENCPILRA